MPAQMQALEVILSSTIIYVSFTTVKHPLQIKGRKCAKAWHYEPGRDFLKC